MTHLQGLPVFCLLFGLLALPADLSAQEKPSSAETEQIDKAHATAASHRGPECYAVDRYFAEEVWAKIGATTCVKCHQQGGDAEQSQFLLRTDIREGELRSESLFRNQAAFIRMANATEGEESRLLVKITGGLDHGGGNVLKQDSTGYQILAKFVERLNHPPAPTELTEAASEQRPFFENVVMLSPPRLLRRVTLSLAGRLPTPGERSEVQARGNEAIEPILDRLMQEDAFYDRLHEAFNDIFLTRGYDDVPESVYSYDHFNETRHWPRDEKFEHLPEEERKEAGYALYRVYRESILREPFELIEYIVRNDRPFTELVTADYLMVSPYTAKGYGLFEKLRDRFEDPEDPFEYIRTQLPALESRNGKVQESKTGRYPHSGMLTTFHYTRRYPTTDTNRNRLRARMYYQHFLGIDVMQLAPRVTDAAAVDAQYEIPTMQAADCVVCHKTVDPVAGLFQDYNDDGYFAELRDGWHQDMFPPGLEGEDLPDQERWRALQWLGQRTADDPRFAVAMVEHVYYILTGRQVMSAPQDIDDPLFAAKRRGYVAQRQMIQSVADRFVADNFNLKTALQAMIASRWYRADGLETAKLSPQRAAELNDLGVVRLLTPEQLERKIAAVFGQKWGRLKKGGSGFEILYGGIDSKEITERISAPSGAIGAIQRMMANQIACENVALDFTTKPTERVLFPHIEPSLLPEQGEQAQQQIRQAIVHLHWRILGQEHQVDHPEVERTYRLFESIVSEAKSHPEVGKQEIYFCRGKNDKRLEDPHYTLRGWRAVVTYLLRQHDFLYE